MPTDWAERVDDLRYDGERERHRAAVGDATVVVTSHRVLAFVPEGDGRRFRQVDRPNVARVGVDAGGDPGHLLRAVAAGVVGLALLAAASRVSAAALLAHVDAGSGAGATGVAAGTLETLRTVLATIDLAVLLGGIGACGVALALAGWYLRTRSRDLVLEVRGGADVVVPLAGAALEDEAVAALESAIRPAPRDAGDRGRDEST